MKSSWNGLSILSHETEEPYANGEAATAYREALALTTNPTFLTHR